MLVRSGGASNDRGDVPGKASTIVEHSLETSLSEMRLCRVLPCVGQAETAPCASSSSRSIPNDLNKAKPLANASRRTSRPLFGRADRYDSGFFIKHKRELATLPILRYLRP